MPLAGKHRLAPVRGGRSPACGPGTAAPAAPPLSGEKLMPRGSRYVPPGWSVEAYRGFFG